jgi:hypothetical protein
MGYIAALIGCIGGLCGIFGILIATDIITADMNPIKNVGWDFWFMLAGVLLLGAIALLLGRGSAKD